MPPESLAPKAQQNVRVGSRLYASVLRGGGESGAVGVSLQWRETVCVWGGADVGVEGQCRVSWSIRAMPEGWAMHEPSSPAGGLSSGGDGCGQVSCPAWPLGTLPSPISQAASLPVYYPCCPRRWCLIRAQPGPRAEKQTACLVHETLLSRFMVAPGGSGESCEWGGTWKGWGAGRGGGVFTN